MAEDNKVTTEVKDSKDIGEIRKKGLLDGLNNSPIGGLFGGRPWILLIAVAFVVLILLLVIVASLAGRKGAASAGNAQLVADGNLTVALVVGDDRFSSRTGNGGYTGIEPVLAQNLADTEGITLRVVEADSIEAALSLLDAGEADMALGRIGTDRDLSRYTISESYGNSGLFFVTTLHDYTDALDLMAGYSVGIMDNISDVAKNLSGYLYISPHDYNSIVTLGEDIKARKVSFGLCNEKDALSLIKSYPNDLQAQSAADGPKELYVAVFRGRSNVHATLFNAVLSTYMDEKAGK